MSNTANKRIDSIQSAFIQSSSVKSIDLQRCIAEHFKSMVAGISDPIEQACAEYALKKGINNWEVHQEKLMIARLPTNTSVNKVDDQINNENVLQIIQRNLSELYNDEDWAIFAQTFGIPSTIENSDEALSLCKRIQDVLHSPVFDRLDLIQSDLKSETAREGLERLCTLIGTDKSIHSTPAIHILTAIKKVQTLNKYLEGVPSYEIVKRTDKELRDVIIFLYAFSLFLESNKTLNIENMDFEAMNRDLPKLKTSLATMIETIQSGSDYMETGESDNSENIAFWERVEASLERIFAKEHLNLSWEAGEEIVTEEYKKIWPTGETDTEKTTIFLAKLAKIAALPDVFTYGYNTVDDSYLDRRFTANRLFDRIPGKGVSFSPHTVDPNEIINTLAFLDTIPGFSDNSYFTGFLEGKISAQRFVERMRIVLEFGLEQYFGYRNQVLNDPAKLHIIDNLQPSFSFVDLKKDQNTGNYYVLLDGHRIPVLGNGKELNRKSIAAIASDKRFPIDAKWWSARYEHSPKPKFILTAVGAIEWYHLAQTPSSERSTKLDPLAVKADKNNKKSNEWYAYFLEHKPIRIRNIVLQKSPSGLDVLVAGVNTLRNSPSADHDAISQDIKRVIQIIAERAFYRALMPHVLWDSLELASNIVSSNALQTPIKRPSRLYATDELEAERRLLGIIGVGRITVDELVASLAQTAETTVPFIPAEETPTPVEVIETVDYEQYVHTQGLKYVPTDVDVVPGTTRTPTGGEYHEYDFMGYGSYPKLRTLLEMNFDSSAIKIHATQNGYHIVHINSNINKTVVISDEQGKATYIFNGLVPVPKKGEMILSDISPELYPQIGGRIYFAGVEQVDEWKDRILERLTDPEWAIKEMKRLERLDDNMTRKCVAEMAKAGIFAFVLNNQDLGKNVSKSRSANQGGHNVDWEMFIETWNMFIEYRTDEEIQAAGEKRWWDDTTRFPLFERYISHVAAEWRAFIDLHPEFSAHRLPPFNRFFQMLGGLPSLNSYKSHSKKLPEYSATMLAGTVGDDVAHVLDYMNGLIRTSAIENASMRVSLFIDGLLCWELPRPIAADFENTPSWKVKYEARNNLPKGTIPHGLGNTTSLVIYLGGRTDEVDPFDFNAVAQFVNSRIDGHKVK